MLITRGPWPAGKGTVIGVGKSITLGRRWPSLPFVELIRVLRWNHEPAPAKARDVWKETVQLPWSDLPAARVIETVLRAGAGSPA